jgi:D-sedoheptulose 7-phosphate isomerase
MSFPLQYKSSLLQALDTIDLVKVEQLIEAFATARDEERQIFVCGNGGSAATANHLACDIVKGAS